MKKTKKTVKARLAKNDAQRIAAIQRRLAQLEQEQSAVNMAHRRMAQVVEDIESNGLSDMQTRVTAIENEDYKASIKGILFRLEALEASKAGMLEIAQRVDRLENSPVVGIGTFQSFQKWTRDLFGTMQAQQAKLQTQQDGLAGALSDVENTVEQLNAQPAGQKVIDRDCQEWVGIPFKDVLIGQQFRMDSTDARFTKVTNTSYETGPGMTVGLQHVNQHVWVQVEPKQPSSPTVADQTLEFLHKFNQLAGELAKVAALAKREQNIAEQR